MPSGATRTHTPRYVWLAGFEPATPWILTKHSDQAELQPEVEKRDSTRNCGRTFGLATVTTVPRVSCEAWVRGRATFPSDQIPQGLPRCDLTLTATACALPDRFSSSGVQPFSRRAPPSVAPHRGFEPQTPWFWRPGGTAYAVGYDWIGKLQLSEVQRLSGYEYRHHERPPGFEPRRTGWWPVMLTVDITDAWREWDSNPRP